MRYRAQSPALARPAFTVDALRRSKIQPCGTRVRSPGSCCGSGPLPVPPRNGSDGLQTGGSAPTSRLRRSGARRTVTSLPSSRSCCGCHGMRLRSFREHRTTGSWSGSPAAVRPTSTRGFRRCRRGTTRAGPGDGGGRGWAHRKSGWGRRDPAERSQFTRLCADWRCAFRGPPSCGAGLKTGVPGGPALLSRLAMGVSRPCGPRCRSEDRRSLACAPLYRLEVGSPCPTGDALLSGCGGRCR